MNIEESFSNRGEQSGCDARTSSLIGAAIIAAAIAKPWPSGRPSSTAAIAASSGVDLEFAAMCRSGQLCRIASC
jgi:hypothetical protein